MAERHTRDDAADVRATSHALRTRRRDGGQVRVAPDVRRSTGRVGLRGAANVAGVATEGRTAADRIDELLARLCLQLGPALAEALMLQALHGARVRSGLWSPSAFLRNLQRLASAFGDGGTPSDAPALSVARRGPSRSP